MDDAENSEGPETNRNAGMVKKNDRQRLESPPGTFNTAVLVRFVGSGKKEMNSVVRSVLLADRVVELTTVCGDRQKTTKVEWT